MKKYLLSIFLLFTMWNLKAQIPSSGKLSQPGRIYGKVTDVKTKKGLDAVSVQLSKPVNDATTGNRKDSIIAGMFTRANGDFSFENILFNDSVSVLITAIGY